MSLMKKSIVHLKKLLKNTRCHHGLFFLNTNRWANKLNKLTSCDKAKRKQN